MKLYAGDAPTAALPAGCAARIMTGAPLPAGADCVLMQELTDGGEENVRIYRRTFPQRERGLPGRGHRRRSPHRRCGHGADPGPPRCAGGAGLCGSAGRTGRSPSACWLPAANCWPPARLWLPAKSYDANGIQNAARLRQMGFAVQRRHCSDDPALIVAELEELLTGCDAVVTSGGVSVGQKDYLPVVLESLGARACLLRAWPRSPAAPCWRRR